MAESGPPLGTVLGNLGINAVKFCNDFNAFTQELPNYFLLKVVILIFEDKSYSFSVSLPSVGFFLRLLKFDRIVKINGKDFTEQCIFLKSVILLSKLYFPDLDLKTAVSIICGSVQSSGLIII